MAIPHPVRHARLIALRRPVVYWLLVAVVAVATASVVGRLASDAADARRAWGTSKMVLVATTTAEAGQPVVAELRRYPVAVIPPGALSVEPAGEVAAQTIRVGEIVTSARLGGRALPTGTRALAIAVDGPIAVRVGDRVDVVGATRDARVLEVRDGVVVLAVDEADVGAVAVAVRDRSAVLARAT